MVSAAWAFIAICTVLRVLEGVGSALLFTAIFSTFAQLFPKSVSTLVVC